METTVEIIENVWTVTVEPEIGETVTVETPAETEVNVYSEIPQITVEDDTDYLLIYQIALL